MRTRSLANALAYQTRQEPTPRVQTFGRALPINKPKHESYVTCVHNKLGIN